MVASIIGLDAAFAVELLADLAEQDVAFKRPAYVETVPGIPDLNPYDEPIRAATPWSAVTFDTGTLAVLPCFLQELRAAPGEVLQVDANNIVNRYVILLGWRPEIAEDWQVASVQHHTLGTNYLAAPLKIIKVEHLAPVLTWVYGERVR